MSNQILVSIIHKFKIAAQMRNAQFELLNKSYSAPDIQDYFEHIIKKHKTLTDNHPIQTYVNRIENRITLKIKYRCFLNF